MRAAEHYDQEYTKGKYARQYAALPAYAVCMNQWSVDYVIALLGLHPSRGPVLDLGSGRGHIMDAWAARGFKAIGREISRVAVEASGRSDIHLGDATDLSGYADDEFQLVFSNAFLEHIDDAAVDRILREEMRVAPYAAHYIAHERGNDPGHINVKLPREWDEFFRNKVPVASTVGNPIVFMSPVFLHMRALPLHIEHASRYFMRQDGKGSIVNSTTA